MDCLALSKVLPIGDGQKFVRLVIGLLPQYDSEARQVYRGDAALTASLDSKLRVVVLDPMLPGQNGLQTCREIRRVASPPILILIVQEDDLDHTPDLESGVDNYVVRLIEPPVLPTRLCVLMRWHASLPASSESLTSGKLNVDRRRHKAEFKGCGIELTMMEFGLLWLLANQAGEILSCDRIFNQTRGIGFSGLSRSVDVCISKLHNKLRDNPREPVRIRTVWGKGYLFNLPGREF